MEKKNTIIHFEDDEALALQEKAKDIISRYESAKARKENWQSLWAECYDFTLPQRGGFTGGFQAGQKRNSRIYDATALDAVDQLAASLLGNLTPIWSQWFGLKPGPDLSAEEADALAPVLEKAAQTIQAHFDRSNFAVEIHQAYLDLIVGGTASISFEEAEPGEFSAFRFCAVPLKKIVLEQGTSGLLDYSFRIIQMRLGDMVSRYPSAVIPDKIMRQAARDQQSLFPVMESVIPNGLVYEYMAFLFEDLSVPVVLQSGKFSQSPMINFRWMKSPDEIYGRSPVMKALPDIKTANKVVELILKNASIAVTGIWQADDDGVLNPANIELTPGSIIPKAVGSKGLQPLDMPGRFDVSQLVLENLQSRIRHALLGDKLAPIAGPAMTATEVLERSAQMSLILGATYGRLQSELLTPLIKRAFSILRRRGEVPDISLDGRLVAVDYRSPLARSQGQRNVQNTLSWINSVLSMGPEAALSVDLPAAARFLAEALAVPSDLVRKDILKVAEDVVQAIVPEIQKEGESHVQN
ncbi:MAG: portal protein [Alphaproteobacteria bacterium]|nr:portal protein [Alphaproteobacteria bacterium]